MIRLSEQVAPMFHDTFNSMALHQIDKGGRGSTKTSKNALKIVLQLMSDSKCNVVVIRRHFKYHRNSTFRELKKAFNRLGVDSDLIELGTSPMHITYKLHGNKVYFGGLDDFDNLKGMIPDQDTINIIWFFEISQFRDDYDMQQVIATFSRGNPDYFMCIYEYNPPPVTTHWVYDWLSQMSTREDCIVTHTTYEDLPDKLKREWLGKYFIQEAETIKELDYEQYKSIYLGQAARLKGIIYKKFDRAIHAKHDNGPYMAYTIGVDYGETDATVFNFTGFKLKLEGVSVLKTYRHKNGRTQKDINDYCTDFFEFAGRCYEIAKRPIEVYVDSASKSFLTVLRNEAARKRCSYLLIKPVNKSKHSEKSVSAIKERIDLTNLMLGCKNYLHIDPSCTALLDAFESCESDDNGIRIDDGSYDIDSLDAWEYSFLRWYDEIMKGLILIKGVQIDAKTDMGNRIE